MSFLRKLFILSLFAKHAFSACNMPCFAFQYAIYYKVKGYKLYFMQDFA